MIPTARKTNLVQQESGDELLVYDLDIKRAICLNKTSALVWQYCDGTNSPKDICKKLGKTLGAQVTEDLVWFALKQLHEEKLLKNNENFEKRFSGLTRRETVKRIGPLCRNSNPSPGGIWGACAPPKSISY